MGNNNKKRSGTGKKLILALTIPAMLSIVPGMGSMITAETVAAAAQATTPDSSARYWKLNDAEKKAYLALKDVFVSVVSGEKNSATLKLKYKDLFTQKLLNTKYVAKDLGLDSLLNNNNEITEKAITALNKKYSFDARKVFDALLFDCPELMCWVDKTTGMKLGTNYLYAGEFNSKGEVAIWCDGESSFTFSFTVTGDYAGKTNQIIDKTKIGSISYAITKAENIVKKAKSLSDLDKLTYYKDEICKMVSYNKTAAENSKSNTSSYGNAWQIVNVFDGNSSTNVVCEGYAKAFKLLCDLTDFNDDSIKCHLVSGKMTGGTGAGNHMWNVLSINGSNYLADLTNCDSGTVGYPDNLFLVGDSIKSANGYTISMSGKSVKYEYDSVTKSLYSNAERTLAAKDHSSKKAKVTKVAVPVAKKGLVYSGKAQTGVASASAYTVKTGSATKAGSYTAVVTLKDKKNYTWSDGTTSDKKISWSIAGASIAKLSVTGITDKNYTGKAITQNTTVKLGNVTLKNGTDYKLTYSNNVKAGTAKVTVTGIGNYTGKLSRSFKIVLATKVKLNKTAATLTKGSKLQLTATVTPSGLVNKKVKWTSSNTAVATVDSTGKVTAKKAGTAKITAKTVDGGKTAVCTVTVKK